MRETRPVIVDYEAGNVRSVIRAVESLGYQPIISNDPATISNADSIIFPGQGASEPAMVKLKENGTLALYLPAFMVLFSDLDTTSGHYRRYEKKDFIGDSTTIKYYYFAPQGSFVYDTRDIYTDPSKGVYVFHSAQYYKYLDMDSGSLFWTQSYSAYASPIKGNRKTTVGANLTLNSTYGDLYKERN